MARCRTADQQIQRYYYDLARGATGAIGGTNVNQIRNSVMNGAVVSPDTIPTNWAMTAASNGVNRDIVGVGTDLYPYIDVQWVGTASAATTNTLVSFDSNTNPSAVAINGDMRVSSCYVSLTAGSFANVSLLALRTRFNDGAGTSLTTAQTSMLGATATPARFEAALTASNASTAFAAALVVSSWVNAGAVDFTLRFQGPQLEAGLIARTVKLTSA